MILWFQIFKYLHHTDGVVVQDNNDTYTYPMPMYAQGKMMFCG
jgi:aspartate-semialdehyde dehydrogenase